MWGGGEQGSLASARGSRAASERAAGEGGRSAARSAPWLSRVTAWAKRGKSASLTPPVVSDSLDRAIFALRIGIFHTRYNRLKTGLRLACGAQWVLADLLNAALCLNGT